MATGLDAQQKIFASNPDDRRAFEALEEHFFLEGDWESLVRVYRERIDAPALQGETDQLSPLLFRLGQILEERVLDLDEAANVYWTLARLEPTNRPALRQLRGIHERRGQWDMVLQIAELEGKTAMPPYERAAFETALGRTWQQQLQDPEEARACFERALEADPDFPAALEGLAELHREAGRVPETAEILERLTRRLRGPERAPVWIALGTLYAGALESPVRARECFSAALEDDPFQAPAVEWSLLLATVDEDWAAVSELLESRFDLASGARHRSAIAVEASQIQLNHLGSPASARAWVDRALELGAEEPSVLLAASDVERADGDRDALLKALDRLIRLTGTRAPRAALIEAAELHAEFGHPEAALDAIRRAEELSGESDEQVLTIHAQLLRQGGSKRDLAEVLETLTALEPGEDVGPRAAQLRELATLQEEDLGDVDTACANWRQAFDLEPGEGPALEALDRIYRKQDDSSALRHVLETALEAAGENPSPALPARLGEVILDRFDDPEAARGLFDRALAIDESCAPALTGLRRVADTSDDPDLLLEVSEREARDCCDASRMTELANSVLPILEERGEIEEALRWATRWSGLSPAPPEAYARRADYEQQLERPDAEIVSRRALSKLQTGRDRSLTLERQAKLHFELGQDEEATKTFERALESHPNPLAILETLCDVYRRLDQPHELVRALRQRADLTPPDDQADLLEELAGILEDPLGDLDTAIVVRWRLVELPDPPAEAPGKLEALLEMAGRYSELAQLFDARRQGLGDESPEAFDLDMRHGTLLLEALGHCDEAASIFASLHERHPESEEIVGLLERALRSGDDAAGLCALLERRAEWEDDGDRQAELRLERAALMEESLGDPHSACDLYESILEEHAQSDSAATAAGRLEILLESTGQWGRLRDRMEARADGLPDAEQATIREHIALLCLDRLNDAAGCAAQLEIIAELTSDRVHIWQQLQEIYAHELERPADWLRVVEAELGSDPAPERELVLRVGAARVYLDDDRRPEGCGVETAYEHYERIAELDPSNAEAVEVLAAHFVTVGRHAEAARMLEARLEGFGSAEGVDVTDLRLRLARLYAGPLEDDQRARPLLESARLTLGVVPQVAGPLAELYERSGAHEPLVALAHAVLGDESSEAFRNEERLLWRLRLAASEHALGRFEEAATAYRAALVESPDDREIEDALIEIYEELEEIEPLIELLEKRLPYAREDETTELRLRLARLHVDEGGESTESRRHLEDGLQHLEWILDAHPQHLDAYRQALELAERMGDPERQLSLLNRGLALSLPDVERAGILERRAALFAGPLDSAEQAVLSLREAVSLDRSRESARTALRTQLERLERWPAVLDCLFVEAMESTGTERFELFEEAAEIAWTRVNPDASLPWLARMREERPDDPELYARLAEVHRRAGRFEAALCALDEELVRRPGRETRCELHLQRARLLERELHSPARAIHAYVEALDQTVNRLEILSELDRLYDLMGRPTERAEILEAQVEILEGESQIAVRRTLSSLYCVDLARPERAIPHLEANAKAQEGSPQDELATLGALDAALRASGRHDAWILVAERELELIESDAELDSATPIDFKRYLREELARAYDEWMGDADRALDHLRVLCRDERASSPRAERMRELLRRTGRVGELASELTRCVDDGDGQATDWIELARLREESLLDLPGAREAYREAQSDPDTRIEAVRGLRRCSERLRDWQGMTEALEAEYQLEGGLQRSERTAIARRLGDLCWKRLSDGQRATDAYQLALDLDARDLSALRSMIDVRESCSQTPEAVELYRRELEILGDDSEHRLRRLEVWLRLARLLGNSDETREAAIEAYRSAAQLERLAPEDELRLARLYEATGDMAAYCESFGSWCDREQSGAGVSDHLSLVQTFLAQGESESARARCQRATAVAPESAEAWAVLADLTRDEGSLQDAAEAFERAAEHSAPRDAASYLVEAAACVETSEVERAYALLSSATERDPASLSAHATLTRVASKLGHVEETEREAERALELACTEPLDADLQVEVALLGGRAARSIGHLDRSRLLFERVLEIDPDQIEALEGVAIAFFEEGDFSAARVPLERRIELGGDDPDRSKHLTIIARGLEAEEHLDAAWARYEEALEEDRSNQDAHEGVVRVHERSARPEEALAALDRWSMASEDSETRALAAFRAAEHALALEDPDRARIQLERATESDPQLAPAWVLLCDLVGERGPDTEARTLCRQALDSIEPGALSARISLRAARLAEIAGDTAEARARYGETTRWDPRASEAALCESRLARMDGDWVEADGILTHFIEAHPDPESPSLAHVHLERGRLLSGPLEKFEQAIAQYEAALVLQPEMAIARTHLASLLLHAPGRWREALELHREILEASPTTANSLRAIRQLAEARGQDDVAEGALAVLRALGLASPDEDDGEPAALRFPIHPGPPMSDPDSECLRRIAHQVSEELGGVLAGATPARPSSNVPEVDSVLAQIAAIEDELSAPGLARLTADERSELFLTLGALFLDPGGNGPDSRFRVPLDEALGRWSRRKVRRIVEETNLGTIEAVDQAAWGNELRAIASAQSLDRNGGELQSVLRALLVLDASTETEPAFEGAEIGTLASTSDSARRLLTRVTTLLCERLDRSG